MFLASPTVGIIALQGFAPTAPFKETAELLIIQVAIPDSCYSSDYSGLDVSRPFGRHLTS